MVCPQWTSNPSQPIALDDVATILAHCVDDEATRGRVCEIGGPDVLTYREMMRETARVLHKRRLLIPVPVFSPGLSRLWVTLVTGSPKALVAPLVRSLKHPMVVEDGWLQEHMGLAGVPFQEALRGALGAEGLLKEPTARSIQRLPRPDELDAMGVAEEYLAWLPRFLRPLLRVERRGDACDIGLHGLRRPLMQLAIDRSQASPSRVLLHVSGGSLAGATPPDEAAPSLEFRITSDGRQVIAAVQGFRPRLPWWLYVATQAKLHRFIMWGFARHLARLPAVPRPAFASGSPRRR